MILKINDRIRTRQVEFFNDFTLDLKYDSIASSFGFNVYFDPENEDHVELIQVGHYHIANIEHNGEQLIRGYILSEAFKDSDTRSLVPISGYSLGGVLEDSNIPVSLYPLQYDGLTLREIATKLVAPFGLKIVVDASVSAKMDSVYDVSTANEKQSIKQYLSELASQKNIIISHDEFGNILFTQVKTDLKPILNFDGGLPFTEMSLQFNGQALHSEITVMKQASSDGGNAGQATVINPFVPYVYRPKVIIQNSGDDNDTELVAKMALAEELKNIKLTIITDRWEVNGKIIKPNNLITVVNKKLNLFTPSNWFIEEVKLVGDAEKTVATLTCVLPECYNNQTPKYIFKIH
jgi:prophage tail gpP-like protein